MIELTLSNVLIVAALLALLGIIFVAPTAPFAYQRPLSYLALGLGVIAGGWLLGTGVWFASVGAGKAAAEHFLAFYVLSTATWLAWKTARPF